MTCSDIIKDRARTLGFDACGVAAVAPIDPDDCLGAWLARGYHADMTWMAATKDARQDITRKLPGARSVVVVARNYFAPRPPRPADSGRVSRYAWGRDYHRALLKPVKRLADAIRSLQPDAACYISIDAGPVLEKAWAARAGIGWLGKNSLVLRPGLGSWMFLGVVATTVALEPDAPMPDQCGACRACLDACPTGAIIAPGVVDAARCIAYGTIERRGDIPDDIARRMGDWVFGCDVCQDACPWNRDVAPTTDPDFFPRPGRANPDLAELASLDEHTFFDRFRGSPLVRAKCDGLRRNARIARRNQLRDAELAGPDEAS
ncbi:MAG TPA: tRNA epoxyqueuosine(34) reductase QueG [Candidatus Hydrogenedentes bacterium]|nr:tRNA epoxyqueuosine(34) reductase QueG [Candidatus Hydrogenedentota bacterium]HOS01458.1 tRNA epoxyqueuosine(34) reductase QueG [Candidatus Hydrogenedentota bacterium]